MVDKLEACPFCGGQARIDIGKNAFEDAEVSCDACGTQGPNCDDGFGREDNKRLAIAAWNQRATPANGEQVERDWSLTDLRDLHTDVQRIRDHDLGNKRMRDLLQATMDTLVAADVEYAALGNKETDRHG